MRIKRDGWGYWFLSARGESLGFAKDGLLRSHLQRMFSLLENERFAKDIFIEGKLGDRRRTKPGPGHGRGPGPGPAQARAWVQRLAMLQRLAAHFVCFSCPIFLVVSSCV